MSNQGYDEELRAERAYVAGLYERLDGERAGVRTAYERSLRGESLSLVERDVQVDVNARERARLNVADNGLCFGRLDALSGERTYIGRLGIFEPENDYRPLLVDWRAPASRPFYTATAASPEGMRRRRQFHPLGRKIVDFTDDVFGRPDTDETHGDAALLAAVNAPRGAGMRDIVATIQTEQDEIIRHPHRGVVVIEGGPGTGKTAVALHRVAYLLYTRREQLERRGVLVIGPGPAFLRYIGRVLPSLGETDVVFRSPGGLVPGMEITAEDEPDIARVKGSLAMVDVLAAAVADRQELPEEPMPIELTDVTVPLDAEAAEVARAEARASGQPHNDARAVFAAEVRELLSHRAVREIGRGWLSPNERATWETMRADVLEELAEHEELAAAINRLWPVLTPKRLLAQLYTSPERLERAGADPRLHRVRGAAWTVSDVPLLDEAVDLLGQDRSAEIAAERLRREEAEYAQGVLDVVTVERMDLMDDEDHLIATDLVTGDDLAERRAERDTRSLAERAVEDRDWTYGHVVVDEAQELSEMDWRVLMRRCPSKSFTIVGDLAQRRSPAGATSWPTVLDRYVPGRWEYRRLSVNYRTPAEIMAVAAALLREFAPGEIPPESVRANGVRPWSRQTAEVADAVADFLREEAEREGTCVVIGPPDVEGAVAPADTKGLEYDAVLVVEPDRILAEGPRGAADLYVALTRATQRLGVVHTGPLPRPLSSLAPAGERATLLSHRRFQ